MALRDVPETGQAPTGNRLRWPLAALGVLVLGAAIAVALVGSGGPAQPSVSAKPALVKPTVPVVPRAAPTAPSAPPQVAPTIVPTERARRGVKPHASRVSAPIAPADRVVPGKKSKADDKVAPSPYQSDE